MAKLNLFGLFKKKQRKEPAEAPPVQDDKPLRGLLEKEAYVLEEFRKKMGLEKELPPLDDENNGDEQ